MSFPYTKRYLFETELADVLKNFPVAAILGPRQCGKSTLARHILSKRKKTIYLDAEKPSDVKKLQEPELFFQLHRNELICIDEIQHLPDIFKVLRSVIDERGTNGQFLLLGSASPELLRQSSETLAGRIVYLELSPFLFQEIKNKKSVATHFAETEVTKYWMRGGFPRSFLATDEANSIKWRKNFIKTFLEKDIPQLGINIPAATLQRLWTICAHHHGQLINTSQFGGSLGLSHTTIRHYLELLSQTFVIRILPPYYANIKKRIVKTPKIYIRDSGLLHSLLSIETMDDLMGHPIFGFSWEGMVVENILAMMRSWEAGFYRTATGVEIDLVLTKGRKKIAVECKASPAPEITKGFWLAMDDIKPTEAWVIAPVNEVYPLKKNVTVAPLEYFLNYCSKL